MRYSIHATRTALGCALLLVVWLAAPSHADPLLDPLRDLLVRTATRFVSEGLKGSVHIGALRGSLLGSPVLQRVELLDARGEVVARIDEVRLSYSLISLLQQRLEVNRVVVVQPQLTIRQEADGTLNITDAVASKQPAGPPEASPGFSLPFALVVEDVQIQNGQMSLHVPALAGVKRVEELHARLNARVDQEGFRAQLQQMTAKTQPANVTLHALQGAVRSLGGSLEIDQLRLETDNTTVTAHGVLPGGQPGADLEVQMQPLSVSELGHLTHTEALRGEVRLTLHATGPPEALQVSGQIQAGEGRLGLDSQINMVATPQRYRGELNLTHVDLATVVQRDALQSDLNARLHLEARGTSPRDLYGNVQLDVQPSHLGDIALRPSHIHLRAAGGRFQVERFDLNTSAAQMTASGTLGVATDADVQYALQVNLEELQKLLNAEALAGTVHLQGQAHGTWPALAVHGTLQASDLHYQDNHLQALQLTYKGSQLGSQPQGTAQLLAQQARAGTLPIERVRVEAAYQGSERQVHVNARVVQSPHRSGHARGTLTLTDTSQQIVVQELRLRLPDYTWHAPEPWRIALAPQQIHFQQVRLIHDDASISIAGRLDGERLQDIRLQASQIELANLQQFLQAPPYLAGRATLQLHLGGLLAQPQVRGDVVVWEQAQEQLPFERLHTELTYKENVWQSTVQVQQDQRDVITFDLRLPFDTAFTALPLEERIVNAPIEARLQLDQPRLAAFSHWLPSLPQLGGTLAGTVQLRGTYAALDLEANVQVQQLEVADTAEQIQAPIHLTTAIVTADSVPALVRDLRQGQVTPAVRDLELRVPTVQGQLAASDPSAEPFQVRDLMLRAAAQWPATGPRATLEHLQLHASGLGLPPTDLMMAAQWTPRRLDLTRLQMRLPQSELQGQGHLTMPERQIQLHVDIPRLRLDALPLDLPPELPAVVQGALAVRGTLQNPHTEVHLQYAGAQIHGALTAQLQHRLPRYEATLHIDGLQMAQVLPDMQGRLQARAQLQGAGLAEPQRHASLDLSIDTQRLSLVPELTASLQAELVGDVLQVQQFRVRSVPADVDASGTLSAAAQTALHYTLTLGDLTALQNELGVALQASGRLTGDVQGTLEALQTRGTLVLDDWRYAEFQGQRAQVDFTAAQLLSAPRGKLTARLSALRGPSLPTAALRLEGEYASQRGVFTATVTDGPYDQSMLAGHVRLGEDQRLTIEALRLQHQELLWQNADPIRVVRTPQGKVELQPLRLRSGSQMLRAQGTLVPGGPVQARVRVHQLQLRPTLQAVMLDTPVPSGQLTLDLALRGTLQQPQVQGDMQLTALQWQEQDLGAIDATLGLQAQTVRTQMAWKYQGRELLQVRGTVGIGPPGPLDLHLQSSAVDLARLAPLSPAIVESAGTLRLDLRLDGTLRQPQAYGDLELDDGVLQLTATGERYRDIQAHLVFRGDRMTIDQLHVGSRSGPLRLTGFVEQEGAALRQVELTLQAEEFTAMHTPAIEAMVSAAIEVRGSLQEMVAAGTVTVPQARFVLEGIPGGGPRAVQSWELTVEGVYGPGPEAVVSKNGAGVTPAGEQVPLPFLRADVSVDIPRNAWVQGPGTAVEINGNVEVTKEFEAPFVVGGEVSTVRGFASFYGKKFVIDQGQVTFTGAPEINPFLDIRAIHNVSDYVITIHIEGRADEPQLTLTSEPELPQIDIVSLLVLGKTTDRLTGSEQRSLSDRAQQLAGSILARQLEQTIAEPLGLDTIAIETGETLGTGAVSVGRYVTQDLFLSYEREFGEEERNTVSAEYSISRGLKIVGESSDEGDAAVKFRWEIDY